MDRNNLERYFGSVEDAADKLALCVTCFTCPACPTHCDGRKVEECEERIAAWLACEEAEL